MELKEYMMDKEPVTWEELIQTARDDGYDPGELITTSGSANYLRKLGHTIERNPDYKV